MKPVVEQLPKDQIIAELTPDKLLRRTNNGNNEVYIFDNNSPSLMRLAVGDNLPSCRGGTGYDIVLTIYTASSHPQKQLIVGSNKRNHWRISFLFSKKEWRTRHKQTCILCIFPFLREIHEKYYLLMELGRSFVHPKRATWEEKVFLPLIMWVAVCYLDHHHLKYLFGKVTYILILT
jgi:hypothetical protein